jgi:hypothetical protein
MLSTGASQIAKTCLPTINPRGPWSLRIGPQCLRASHWQCLPCSCHPHTNIPRIISYHWQHSAQQCVAVLAPHRKHPPAVQHQPQRCRQSETSSRMPVVQAFKAVIAVNPALQKQVKKVRMEDAHGSRRLKFHKVVRYVNLEGIVHLTVWCFHNAARRRPCALTLLAPLAYKIFFLRLIQSSTQKRIALSDYSICTPLSISTHANQQCRAIPTPTTQCPHSLSY